MKHADSDADMKRSSRAHRRTGRERSATSSDRHGGVGTLHAAVGNQAVRDLHENGKVRAKLDVSQPGDAAEREADRVADRILESAEGDDTEVAELALEPVQEVSPSGTESATSVSGAQERQVRSALRGGRRLPESTRSFFESRFDRNFSSVRVHTGQVADRAARSIEARAFTFGDDIAFARGHYRPDTRVGKRLLAHELTHVVQDGSAIGRQEGEALGPRSFGGTSALDAAYYELLQREEAGEVPDGTADRFVRTWSRAVAHDHPLGQLAALYRADWLDREELGQYTRELVENPLDRLDFYLAVGVIDRATYEDARAQISATHPEIIEDMREQTDRMMSRLDLEYMTTGGRVLRGDELGQAAVLSDLQALEGIGIADNPGAAIGYIIGNVVMEDEGDRRQFATLCGQLYDATTAGVGTPAPTADAPSSITGRHSARPQSPARTSFTRR